ncbi:MAG: citryl-CoA lyase, partial [Pseudomonadales bacterium]|nr:citryl-CoA lyase [Pseudomonadales bacterium]
MTEEKEKKKEVIHSKIWEEIPEPDNPFAAAVCYCSGYDVYGDLLGKISWIEYLYLLFKLEPPTKDQAKLLEGLAVAIANPGPRDLSVRAAMNGGVGGSTAAACLMAALAPGAGQYGGAREVFLAVKLWEKCGDDLSLWQTTVKNYEKDEKLEVWPDMEHPPGFDPYGASCATPIKQTLDFLAGISSSDSLNWLKAHRTEIELAADCPLAITGIAAATLVDLGFDAEQAEMLFLLLRLPGAAVHALEQKHQGWRKYPFFSDGLVLTNDPGP